MLNRPQPLTTDRAKQLPRRLLNHYIRVNKNSACYLKLVAMGVTYQDADGYIIDIAGSDSPKKFWA